VEAEQLRPNEVLVKTKRFDGLTVYRVRVKK
jgi:hypothetical protein